jgi:23S rRNA pseudouridine1911/1915/1917 synthase
MERYLEFRIDEQTTELKMEAFLKKNAGLTKRQISQAKFRPDGITRNGVRCRVTETIYPGDVIHICLEEAGTASAHLENYNDGIRSKDLSDFHSNKDSAPVSETSFSLNILYEDTDILAVDKPAGIQRECIIQTASPILLPVTFERKMNRSVSARWGGWIRRLPGLWFLPKIR